MVTKFDESVLVAPVASALVVERDGDVTDVDLVVGSSLPVAGEAVVGDGSRLHSSETGSFMKHVTYTFLSFVHAPDLHSDSFASWPLQSGEVEVGNGPTLWSSLPAVAPAVYMRFMIKLSSNFQITCICTLFNSVNTYIREIELPTNDFCVLLSESIITDFSPSISFAYLDGGVVHYYAACFIASPMLCPSYCSNP